MYFGLLRFSNANKCGVSAKNVNITVGCFEKTYILPTRLANCTVSNRKKLL